jgi:cbb3-type cytochrome c oxidase subunit III
LRRFVRVATGGAGLAAAALLAAGCGTGGVASAGGTPDTQNGRQLFLSGANGKQSCAACHTLAAAGSSGTIGPNLDDAFATARKEGYAESSIENVVLDQIRLGSGEIATYTTNNKFTVQTPMPPNLVTGQDAIDVAAYVASVAGTSGVGVTPASLGTNGAAIFKDECAGCHTLAAAGATGTVGPNLDQLTPAMAIVVKQVTTGGQIMPAFKGKLSPAQIEAVAKYVSSSAGQK